MLEPESNHVSGKRGAALDTNGCSRWSKPPRWDKDDLALQGMKSVTCIHCLDSSLRAKRIRVRVLQKEHVVTTFRHLGKASSDFRLHGEKESAHTHLFLLLLLFLLFMIFDF